MGGAQHRWPARALAPVTRRLSALAARFDDHLPASMFHRESRPEGKSLALQWLGTAGFRLVADGHHLWLDPHLSRHSLAEVARGPISPRAERIRADVDVAHAVAVGHSHWDHALDVPFIAREYGARVYGSQDTLNICRGQGVDPSQLFGLVPGVSHREGPFELTPYRSRHGDILLGRVPLPGPIARPLAAPAHALRYRVGEVYGLHVQTAAASIYHVGSAELIEAELTGVRADVVLCCTVGRQASERFTERVIDALRPKLIVPCHWDRFWRPIEAPPLQIPGNDLAGFVREVRAHPWAPEVRVLAPRGWTRIAGKTAS